MINHVVQSLTLPLNESNYSPEQITYHALGEGATWRVRQNKGAGTVYFNEKGQPHQQSWRQSLRGFLNSGCFGIVPLSNEVRRELEELGMTPIIEGAQVPYGDNRYRARLYGRPQPL